MNDPILKRIELWQRRLLIRFLGQAVRRRRILPESIDFDKCKFLFIRQDRIGDVLISTPLFVVLKKYYPQATLDVLLSTKNSFVLENDPLIHKRWIYHKRFNRIISLLRSIREERYDFAIDLMDNPSATSTILCLVAGAQWNVGITKDNSYIYDINVKMLSRKDTHIVDRIAQLLIAFKIDPSQEELSIRYYTSPDSDVFAERFLQVSNLLNRRLIGINISAGGKVRFWGIKNYQLLIQHICTNYPEFGVIVLYKPSDEEQARQIANVHSAISVSPVTYTFDQYAALIKRLSILITPDTSAVHLASAFNIPTLVLYVQSNKALRIWEPYNVDCEILVTDIDDLSTIPVSDVIHSLKLLLERYHPKTLKPLG